MALRCSLQFVIPACFHKVDVYLSHVLAPPYGELIKAFYHLRIDIFSTILSGSRSIHLIVFPAPITPSIHSSMEDTLAPFTPTDAERQQPLAQEYIKSAGHISDLQYYYHHDEPSSSKKRHGRSGSEWDVNEANAVRAIPLLDLPPTRIVPARFFPGDDQPGYNSGPTVSFFLFAPSPADTLQPDSLDFAKLRRFIQAASIDDLKAYNDDHFEGNPYDLLFEELAELVTTYTSESSINRVHRRRISGSSHSSDLSTSSNEGKSESLSASALRLFARRTLSNMKADKLLLIPGRKGPNIVGVNFRGSHSGSNRTSEVPVINFECKTRDAGGVRRRSGDREKFIPTVFAQEVSEMIGSTIAQRAGLLFIKHSDQEAFVVSVHGTLFYISAAYFSPEYIGYIETAEPAEIAVGDNLLWIRRSIHFDLKRPEDRGQALKFFWALVKYIASGEARSNMVAAAIDAARDIPVE
ncbi:hypothetical protein ASPNIDRAFT_38024 [Aspergillus niger ATCC 1015]|uniref:Uncharacterized protein n=1 Tax=Aspergillus niger (strain ATCC 1015 / CBS 113.46 / FGSC A1144 / LSHB Ac4 / NCTC 3858a / NRRL 328 / USDA 3528.7) TaxID=380704 RepID=G3YF32_ASPNA|nr:hypothetical protein ASPNIDRAFT_38024 [Aspergillus niger ATCC 1015]